MGHRVYKMEIGQAVYVVGNVSAFTNEEERRKERLSSATTRW